MEIPLPSPLDSLLGSLEQSAITCFYGSPGSGKTNICLLAAIACATAGGNVSYIDTESSFSAERFQQVGGKPWADHVHVIHPATFREQGETIRHLDMTDFVVVDSMVSLYRIAITEPQEDKRKLITEANRELSKQFSVLSAFAREQKIPVLVTCHTYQDWDTGKHDVVGGDAVKYWSKCLVFLEYTGKTSERRATLIKHRSLPEHGSVKFQLVREGIKPSGFRLF